MYRRAAVVNMDTLDPKLQIQSDTAAQREALAAEWLSGAQVSARLGLISPHGDNDATQLRRQGKLLAVYMAQPVPCYRYPTWQFRAEGLPIDGLADILRVLRNLGSFEREPDGLARTTGWGEVEWFLSPHALLDERSPAEELAISPERVLQAARTELECEG